MSFCVIVAVVCGEGVVGLLYLLWFGGFEAEDNVREVVLSG